MKVGENNVHAFLNSIKICLFSFENIQNKPAKPSDSWISFLFVYMLPLIITSLPSDSKKEQCDFQIL